MRLPFNPGAYAKMNCPFCKSDLLRTSRFQPHDIFQLLLLGLPVRCRDCIERSYVSIPEWRRIRRESLIRREKRSRRASDETPAQIHSK
jgi:hypothetical protein